MFIVTRVMLVPALMGLLAATMGFAVLWPKTIKEGLTRIFCTISTSCFLGPFVVVLVKSSMPQTFAAAREIVVFLGMTPDYALLVFSAPILIVSGLPAWWILGAFVRWFDIRRNEDVGQMIVDAADDLRKVRKSI